jgi:hypothetical protein
MHSSYEISDLYDLTHAERTWGMSHGERAALLQVLRQSKPESAIEIGTDQGGSLEQIRRFAGITYSIDLDPAIARRLQAEMPNVDFLTGDSKIMIGTALARCAERNQSLGFVLIDGDHSYAGVQADIHAVLQHKPTRPVWILMHDSYHPPCRAGIAEARWSENPHVHLLDLDFVTGVIAEDDSPFAGTLWGGFALALLLPEPRSAALGIASKNSANYRTLLGGSLDAPTFRNALRKWWRGKKRGLARRLGK